MSLDGCSRIYEEPSLLDIYGGAIRPGGLELTRRALSLFPLQPDSRVLDAGCGAGATLAYLEEQYDLHGLGIDLSGVLLRQARKEHQHLSLLQGKTADLPLADAVIDAVFAECSLSLMGDLAATIREVKRVLKADALLVISDIYLRLPQYAALLKNLPFESCLCGAVSRRELSDMLLKNGFSIELWEDHSVLLRTFAAQLIFAHGSMAQFWGCASEGRADADKVQWVLRQAKPGYYLCIARKLNK